MSTFTWILRNFTLNLYLLWQTSFPCCPVCGSDLSQPMRHQGVENSRLLTRNDLMTVDVLVQKCTRCKIMFQAVNSMRLNVGDTLIISLGTIFMTFILKICLFLDILFLMRRLVHDGSPLSTVASSLLYDIGLRSDTVMNLESSKKEWIARLLTIGE